MESDDDIENPVEPTPGEQYDLCAVTFGWWEYDGEMIGKRLRGYHWQACFDLEGVYQGPNAEGIYPVFWLD